MRRNLLWTSLLLSCVLVIGIDGSALQLAVQSSNRGASSTISGSSSAEFEVSSVRTTDPRQGTGEVNSLRTYPGARVVARGANLDYLLMRAYDLQQFQIVGGPRWIREAKFDIDAKPPDDVASRYAQLTGSSKNLPSGEIKQMLRNLLTERFQLKLHLQQSQGQIYALVKSGRPLRLSPSKDPDEFPWAGGLHGMPGDGGLRGMNESMSDLAGRLSGWLSMSVVDRTNLSGSYDFEVLVDESPDDASSELGVHNGLFESLKELGLQLKKSTGLVQTLAVDQASLPDDN